MQHDKKHEINEHLTLMNTWYQFEIFLLQQWLHGVLGHATLTDT